MDLGAIVVEPVARLGGIRDHVVPGAGPKQLEALRTAAHQLITSVSDRLEVVLERLGPLPITSQVLGQPVLFLVIHFLEAVFERRGRSRVRHRVHERGVSLRGQS